MAEEPSTQEQATQRPEFLKEKFTSVEAQAKAYGDLESRFGSFTGSPDNYSFGDGVDGKDPRITGLVDIARNSNMNNDLLNKIIQLDSTSKEAKQKAFQDEQMKILGDKAQDRLTALNDWGKNNVPPEMQDTFKLIATNAKAVEFLEHIMGSSKPQTLADGTTVPNQGITKDELDAMQFAKDDHGNRLISVNPDKRAEFDEAYRRYQAQG